MRRLMSFLIAVPIALAASAYAEKLPKHPPVAVFVMAETASAEGFVDNESKERADALKDVRNVLSHKPEDVTLVDSPEAATVVLEILNRKAYEDTGTTKTTGNMYHSKTEQVTQNTLYARLHVGDYTSEISGSVPTSQVFHVWRDCAGAVAHQTTKWIATNYEKLAKK
jgi:hypothetical protein